MTLAILRKGEKWSFSADRRAVDGDGTIYSTPKIEHYRGWTYVMAGDNCEISRFTTLIKEHLPLEPEDFMDLCLLMKGTFGLLFVAERQVFLGTSGEWTRVDQDVVAIGTGAAFALGYLQASPRATTKAVYRGVAKLNNGVSPDFDEVFL